jgi:hypothetical protein
MLANRESNVLGLWFCTRLEFWATDVACRLGPAIAFLLPNVPEGLPAPFLLGLLTTKIFMFPAAAAYVFASFWPLRLLPGAFLRPGSLQTHKRKSSRPLNSYSIGYCKFVCCSLFAFSLYVLSNIEKEKPQVQNLRTLDSSGNFTV